MSWFQLCIIERCMLITANYRSRCWYTAHWLLVRSCCTKQSRTRFQLKTCCSRQQRAPTRLVRQPAVWWTLSCSFVRYIRIYGCCNCTHCNSVIWLCWFSKGICHYSELYEYYVEWFWYISLLWWWPGYVHIGPSGNWSVAIFCDILTRSYWWSAYVVKARTGR